MCKFQKRAHLMQKITNAALCCLGLLFTNSMYCVFSYYIETLQKKQSARLAQSVEHETLNLRVVGSSPTLGASFCCVEHQPGVTSPSAQVHNTITAPWLSWLKRLSSKQEIPSSNLGGAFLLLYQMFMQGENPLWQACIGTLVLWCNG